jgi:hypothetical protein
MAVPAAPTAGEPIAEAWGDVVHDAVVAQDIQAGNGTVVWAASSISNNLTVIFPRPFAAPPIVVASGGHAHYSVSVVAGSITATQCVLQGRRTDGTSQSVSIVCPWVAYGPRA